MTLQVGSFVVCTLTANDKNSASVASSMWGKIGVVVTNRFKDNRAWYVRFFHIPKTIGSAVVFQWVYVENLRPATNEEIRRVIVNLDSFPPIRERWMLTT